MVLAAEAICILTGMTPLIFGFAQFHLFPVAIGCFGFGILWLLSGWRRLAWVAQAGLAVFIFLAVLGVWIGISPFLMALSVLGSLLAWDLRDFSRRLSRAAAEDDLRGLEKNYLVQLARLGAIGLCLILAALLIHLRISFGWLLVLAFTAVLGMVQLVKRFRM